MTTLEVRPADLEAAAADMRLIGATVSAVNAYARDHITVPDGGAIYDAIASEVNRIRDDMLDAYGSFGPVANLFYGAGDALGAIAYDYTQVDLAQAREYDTMLPDVDEPSRMKSYEFGTDEVGLDQAVLLDFVASPPSDEFSDYNTFEQINETVDGIIGLGWIGDALGKVGLDFDPAAKVQEEFGGDWSAMGRALGGLEQVQRYWTEVSQQLQGVVARFETTWSGNAADAAKTWFATLQEKAFGHGKAIGKSLSRIKAEALAFLEALSALKRAVDAVTGAIPRLDDVGGGLWDTVVGALEAAFNAALGAVKGLIDTFWAAYDFARSAGHAVVAAFAQLTRFYDTEWPPVPGYEAPDVDGPDL